MSITIEATYENGVLKPVSPLPLKEHEKVQVVVRQTTTAADQTYGIVGWAGDADTFDRILNESEEGLLDDA